MFFNHTEQGFALVFIGKGFAAADNDEQVSKNFLRFGQNPVEYIPAQFLGSFTGVGVAAGAVKVAGFGWADDDEARRPLSMSFNKSLLSAFVAAIHGDVLNHNIRQLFNVCLSDWITAGQDPFRCIDYCLVHFVAVFTDADGEPLCFEIAVISLLGRFKSLTHNNFSQDRVIDNCLPVITGIIDPEPE